MTFSFGGTPAPAPGAGAGPGAPPPAPGGSAAAAAPPAAGFSFGGAPAAAAAAPAAPATGGFSFGGAAGSAAAPVGSAPAAGAPAPPGGGGFGAAPPAPTTLTAAPTATVALPTTALSATNTTLTNTTLPPPPPTTTTTTSTAFRVPDYDSIFGGRNVSHTIRRLVQQATRLDDYDQSAMAGQELVQLLSVNDNDSNNNDNNGNNGNNGKDVAVAQALQSPPALTYTAPNMNVRQQLVTTRTVFLEGTGRRRDNNNSAASAAAADGQEAGMTERMLKDVFELSDDLRVSEEQALSLYARVSRPEERMALANCMESPWVPPLPAPGTTNASSSSNNSSSNSRVNNSKAPSLAAQLHHSVPLAARELYFYERSLHLQTLRMLLQHRLRDDEAGRAVVEATDSLLQNGLLENLIRLIRDYSSKINNMHQEIVQRKARGVQHTATTAADLQQHEQQQATFVQVHYDFAVSERQVAAECLFFVAYHTQLTEPEVVALVDLVQELTNGDESGKTPGLVILDPFADVPDPFKDAAPTMASQVWPFQNASPPLQEKDPLAWQQELVEKTWETGLPQLLRCVSTLVTSIICALDGRNVLQDRFTHQPNVFGSGNQLLPPNTMSTDNLTAIHARLCKDVAKNWKRPDILGLLMTAYAMLLRTAPSALTSPRSGPASLKVGAIDIRKQWRECLEAPVELKSFTFARLSLLPALQAPSDNAECDVTEFFLSVYAEFASHYLDVLSASGDRPISRAKWEQEAEEDLRLRRSHLDQQRQFQAWSGTNAVDEEAVPAVVDLLQRPDCMDDVIAFAVALGSLGSDYALPFWSRENLLNAQGRDEDEGGLHLVPSRAVRELERQQGEDDSLRPCYLSFLAVLALVEDESVVQNGAAAIFEMLSKDSDTDFTKYETNLVSFFEVLRWYVRELSPQDYGSSLTSSATSASSGRSGAGSTAYYYHADRSHEDSMAYGSQERSRSESNPARPKPRELSEDNTFILLSHLAVIGNMASKSAAARSAILSVNLPIQSADGTEVVGQDSALMVLFTLAGAPLSPQVRGTVFETIANLLQADESNKDEKAKMREMAVKGWELLEACQVLPIHLLDQYPSLRESDAQNIPGLAFPPSSTALVRDKAGKSWIPADPAYAIVYEMEHIESEMGVYPSTGGFLRLLHALFTVGGSPASLGQNWRVRCGCAPYIEYVIHLVLPRLTGRFPNLPALPFRSLEDESRLSALALAVVETVLTSYTIPIAVPISSDSMEKTAAKWHRDTRAAAREQLGHQVLADTVTVEPIVDDARLYLEDFRSSQTHKTTEQLNAEAGATNTVAAAPDQWTLSAVPRSMAPSVPRPRAPGFAIIAEMLSSTGDLLSLITSILVRHQTVAAEGLEADRMALIFSMFGATPPSFSSAKGKSRKASTSPSRQVLLKALRPGLDSSPSYTSAVHWRGQNMLHVLRIICAVISREEQLHGAMSSLRGQTGMVPVLCFRKKSAAPSRLKIVDLQLSKTTQLLLSSDNGNEALSSIIDVVGNTSISPGIHHDVELAAAAVGILFYVGRSQQDYGVMCRASAEGSARPARSFARRLLISVERCHSIPDAQLLRLILDRILTDLRAGFRTAGSFAQIVLGLPDNTNGGTQRPNDKSTSERSNDCFGALLRMLDNRQFVVSGESAEFATRCYEILFRARELVAVNDLAMQQVIYASDRLRNADFWKTHLALMLSTFRRPELSGFHSNGNLDDILSNENVVHSIAWILKGTASELRQLLGTQAGGAFNSMMAPRPSQYKTLASLLFAPPYEFIFSLLRVLPIERITFDATSAIPSEAAVRGAKYHLPGPEDVVQGYEIINGAKLVELMKTSGLPLDEGGLRAWSDQWNASVARDCAAAHLSSAVHVVLGSALATCSKELVDLDGVASAVDGYKLLATLLGRFATDPREGLAVPKLDEGSFTTATRNLSLATLVTTDYIVARAGRVTEGNGSIEGPAACALLARAVVSSGFGTDLSPDSVRKNERTAILTTALALMLRKFSKQDVREGDAHHFFRASVVLSRLASALTTERSPAAPSPEALIARSCLSLLLDLFENETGLLRAESFVQAVFIESSSDSRSESSIKLLLRRLAALDSNVSGLLQKIAQVPFGGDILLESGIIEALQAAAVKYREEESRVRSSHTHNVAYEELSIVTPSFLLAHLGLMSTLMAIPISSDRSQNISLQILDILRLYDFVFERLVSRFPLDGDVLQHCLRCIAQAQSLGVSVGSEVGRPLTIGRLANDGPFVSKEFDNGSVVLTMHLAENPFPRDMLPALPSRLSKRHSSWNSSVVSVSAPSEKSWWDVLNVKSSYSSSGWLRRSEVCLTEELYDYGVLGADMLRSGLRLIRGSHLMSLLDESTLSRALCRCVDAVRIVDAHIQASATSTLDGLRNSELSKDRDWNLLRAKWEECVSELLLIALRHLRELKSDYYRGATSAGDDFGRSITFSLDHTGLTSTGIGSSLSGIGDENRPDYTMDLSRALRKELETVLL